MALLTEADVNARADKAMQTVKKSARQLVMEASSVGAEGKEFDVFLSHSSAEPDKLLLGVIGLLSDRSLTVYVDRYDDPQLTPNKVTRETAAILRRRMQQTKALLYVHSQHSVKSRWMPWELGYFDALKGKVGIVPVVVNPGDRFKGEEYLDLYPYVDLATPKGGTTIRPYINDSQTCYTWLEKWIHGGKMKERS